TLTLAIVGTRAIAIAPTLGTPRLLGRFLFLLELIFVLGDVIILVEVDDRLIGDDALGPGATGIDRHARALGLAIGQDGDADAIAILELVELAALVFENVEGGFLAGAQRGYAARAAARFLFQQAQRRQAGRRGGA